MDIDAKIKLILQKDFLIHETNFKNYFEGFYQGKVRDNYISKDKRIIIATDRLSAFDRIITTIPFKGQVLNMTTAFWFEKTKKLVPNHVLTVPDPNVMITKECKPLAVEMVIRGYITGSAWRAYEKDPKKSISGINFPPNLVKNQQLDEPVITPSTKAEKGTHDEEISREMILSKEIVPKDIYLQVEEYTHKLFKKGTEIAKKNGLILVDTKYEFGLDQKGNVTIIDEIHTPDSSRFWMAKTYEPLFTAGRDPDVLDKEFVRDWLRKEKNFTGDGPIPIVDDAVKISLCMKYIKNYELVTGQKFDYTTISEDKHPVSRIENKLKELGYIK
nr:phosphoribosylaminoimidazolesuccinocarboxamide synthase [Candidatus Sigynarchaeota archaeon]